MDDRDWVRGRHDAALAGEVAGPLTAGAASNVGGRLLAGKMIEFKRPPTRPLLRRCYIIRH
jgi:hypothetical protein